MTAQMQRGDHQVDEPTVAFGSILGDQPLIRVIPELARSRQLPHRLAGLVIEECRALLARRWRYGAAEAGRRIRASRTNQVAPRKPCRSQWRHNRSRAHCGWSKSL